MATISFSASDPKPYVSFGVSLLSKTDFEETTKQTGQIVFLASEDLIYFDGEYYGITKDQISTLANVVTRVGTLETQVGQTDNTITQLTQSLAAAILDLKNKIGTTQIGDSNTTITSAISAIQSTLNGLTTGVSSVNTKTGAVTLYGSDIAVSSSDSTKIDAALDGKVEISTSDTTQKTNSGITGASLTTTSAIATAIEAAHTAAVTATSTANDKIAKSTSTTAGTVSGVTPASLATADNIVTAIEALATALIGTDSGSTWGENDQKTLSYLKDLITTLQGSVDTLTSTDTTTLNKITEIINEIKSANGSGNDFLDTILDKVTVLLASTSTYNSTGASQDGSGYYRIGTAGATGTLYKNTLQEIIDALSAKIQTAEAHGGVTHIGAGDGISVTNNGVGDVTVSATSAATTTAALVQTGNHGATTAAGSTIQTALADINAAAAGAHTAADNAQTSANTALTQLTWAIIS